MIYYKTKNNSIDDIIKLKQDLMCHNETTSDKAESITSSVKRILNDKEGSIFEKNIRYAFQYKLNYNKIEYPQKIFSKIIKYGENKEKEIIKGQESEITINERKLKFLFDNNFNLIIKDENDKELDKIGSEKSNEDINNKKIKDTNIKISISRYKEMEYDGFFEMENFSVNQFDKQEVEIIYSNVNEKEEKTFKYTMIEIKLGADKKKELITQIRKDSHFLALIKKTPAVIIGFINSNEIKYKNYFNILKNKKCVIYGIKKGIFCGKDITQPIDWDLERRFLVLSKKISLELKELKTQVNEIYELLKKDKEKKVNIKSTNEEIGEKEIIEEKQLKEEKEKKIFLGEGKKSEKKMREVQTGKNKEEGEKKGENILKQKKEKERKEKKKRLEGKEEILLGRKRQKNSSEENETD